MPRARYSKMRNDEELPEDIDSSYGEARVRIIKSNNKEGDDDDEEDLIMQNIKHSPYDDEIWFQTSEANALGKYDDFHTIDWSRDRMRDRIRFRKVKKMKYQGTLWEKIKVGLCIFLICFKYFFMYSPSTHPNFTPKPNLIISVLISKSFSQ